MTKSYENSRKVKKKICLCGCKLPEYVESSSGKTELWKEIGFEAKGKW